MVKFLKFFDGVWDTLHLILLQKRWLFFFYFHMPSLLHNLHLDTRVCQDTFRSPFHEHENTEWGGVQHVHVRTDVGVLCCFKEPQLSWIVTEGLQTKIGLWQDSFNFLLWHWQSRITFLWFFFSPQFIFSQVVCLQPPHTRKEARRGGQTLGGDGGPCTINNTCQSVFVWER